MSQEKNLLQEAIAAAHQVRDAAVKNAVKELEESLTPSIKAMLAQKLDEDVDFSEGTVEEAALGKNTNSGFKEIKVKKPTSSLTEDENEDLEDEEPDGDEEGGKANGNHPEPDGDELDSDNDNDTDNDEEEPDGDEDGGEANGDHPEPDGDEGESEENTELSDDTELSDITLGELKDVITDLIAQAGIGTQTADREDVDMTPEDVQGSGEEDAPLENEPTNKVDDNDEIDLSEILKELEEEQKAKKLSKNTTGNSRPNAELSKLRKENQEYKAAIKELKESLTSINLLNAKLMYTSRMLGKRSLTESQKVRVIRSFDVAQSPEEVKIIYSTLNESFESEAKNAAIIKEHRGTASKPAGRSTAPKSDIIAADSFVRRMQQLAGIIQ